MTKKWTAWLFLGATAVCLLAPWLVFKNLLFPFITSKALFFRLVVELSFPLYVFLVLTRRKLRPALNNPLSLSLLAFVLISLLSALAGVNVARSLWGNFERMGGAFYLATLVALYFYVVLLGQLGGKFFWWFLQLAVGSAVLMSIYGILVRLQWFEFLKDPSFPRISATLGNPIFFGSFLILPMALAAYFAFQAESPGVKVYYWLCVLLQLIGIFLSGTRGAVVGLAIGFFLAALLYVGLQPSRKIRSYGLLSIAVFAVAVGLLFAKHADLPKGTMLSRVFNLQDSNSAARLIQWRVALQGYPERPLLGTGPENYYVVGNKYYSPEIYKYDPSWFDKPHNYLLEILVTTGALGFLAYAAVLIFALWIFWRAYKKEILSLPELCVLAGGLLVYQIQNLFVFDTIPASLMYYCYLGFAGFLWFELSSKPNAAKPVSRPENFSPVFLAAVTAVCGAVMAYTIYATVWMPARIAKAVNYGYAYASADPHLGAEYFATATNLPFNFDRQETASRYADFAVALASGPLVQEDPVFLSKEIQSAVDYEHNVASGVGNDPISWQKLATLYLYQAVVLRMPTIGSALEAAQSAVNLAPKRVEARGLLAQIYDSDSLPQQALLALQMASRFDPSNLTLQFQIATVESELGQSSQAAALAEDLQARGFSFTSSAQMSWLMDYYLQQKKYAQLLPLYQQAANLEPANPDWYFKLAQAYFQTGDKEKAKALAQSLLQYYTTQKNADGQKQIQEFLKTIE